MAVSPMLMLLQRVMTSCIAAYILAAIVAPRFAHRWTREVLREVPWLILSVAVSFMDAATWMDAATARAMILIAYLGFKLAWLRSYDPKLASPLPADCTTPEAVERWLSEREAAAAPLQPVAASRITWSGERGARANVVLVFIHGWSASVQELDPCDARIAAELGATLLRFRLTGHGLKPSARGGAALLQQATRDALLSDIAQAFACARNLGDRVVLFGSSCAPPPLLPSPRLPLAPPPLPLPLPLLLPMPPTLPIRGRSRRLRGLLARSVAALGVRGSRCARARRRVPIGGLLSRALGRLLRATSRPLPSCPS